MTWDPTAIPQVRRRAAASGARPDRAHPARRRRARSLDLGCGAGNVAARARAALAGGADPRRRQLARRCSPARARRGGRRRALSRRPGRPRAWARRRRRSTSSTATLHCTGSTGHATLFPRVLAMVAPGGVLAVQMPDNFARAVARRRSPTLARGAALARAARAARARAAGRDAAPTTSGLARAARRARRRVDHRVPAGAARRRGGEHPVVAWTRARRCALLAAASRRGILADDAARSPRLFVASRTLLAAAVCRRRLLRSVRADGAVHVPLRSGLRSAEPAPRNA